MALISGPQRFCSIFGISMLYLPSIRRPFYDLQHVDDIVIISLPVKTEAKIHILTTIDKYFIKSIDF